MSWSISFGGKNKAAAKRAMSEQLLANMGSQIAHSADFKVVHDFFLNAIDALEEGTVGGTGAGYVGFEYVNEETPPRITNINLSSFSVYSTPEPLTGV